MTGIQKVIKIFAICLASFIIVNIIGVILFALGIVINITEDSNRQRKNFTRVYQNIEKLEIDLESANIIIKEGTEWKVEAEKVNKNFTAIKDHETLKIKEKNKWSFRKNRLGNITVYVPKVILEKLELDGGIGEIQIKDIVARSVEIKQGVGYLRIDKSTFYNTDLETGMGETKITSSTLNNLKMEGGVGSIDIEAYITGISKIECGVGEIKVSLLGKKENYTIIAKKGIGSINIDHQEQKNEIVYGTGNHKMELVGGVGSIDIEFALSES